MKMNSLRVLLVLCVSLGTLAVKVKDGDRTFPLEAVKQLKELMGLDGDITPHLLGTSVAVVCQNPELPEVFQHVCRERSASMVFSRLADTITPPDACEICQNPSCFGCLN